MNHAVFVSGMKDFAFSFFGDEEEVNIQVRCRPTLSFQVLPIPIDQHKWQGCHQIPEAADIFLTGGHKCFRV